MVEDGGFSHKIDYDTIFKEILNLEGHPSCRNGSKVTVILLNRWILPIGEGSTSAACAAGLFLRQILYFLKHKSSCV